MNTGISELGIRTDLADSLFVIEEYQRMVSWNMSQALPNQTTEESEPSIPTEKTDAHR